MPRRPRIAIAHFPDWSAAEPMRAALSTLAAPLPDDPGAGEVRLHIDLPPEQEREILAKLLASDALRVEIHDTDRAQFPPTQR